MGRMFEIVEYDKDVITKDAILIEGFPSVGLISSIAASYLINTLDLECVGAVYSNYLPPASVIIDGTPYPPFRIYSGKPKCLNGICEQLVVMTSEFKIPDTIAIPFADAILDWVKSRGLKGIISLEGLLVQDLAEVDRPLVGTGSTEHAREFLKKQGVELMPLGLVTGISGVLLNEGARKKIDVSCVLAHTMSEVADFRGAAKLITFINKVFTSIETDITPLLTQAEAIENDIKKVRAHQTKKTPEDMIVPIYQ